MSDRGEVIQVFLRNLVQSAQDRIAILRLRWEIAVEKVRNYDRMVADLQAMMQALKTKDRQIADLNRKLATAHEQFESLKQELSRIEARGQAEAADVVDAERRALFKRLESVLVQLPAVRQALASGTDVDGQQVLDITAPLEETMQALGFEAIGAAGAHVSYDPRLHKAVGKGARSLSDDDLVRVRYVGYQYQGEILSKAEVTTVLEKERVS